MRLQAKLFAAIFVLSGFAPGAMGAICTSSTNWGSLGPPGLETFGNSFSSSGNYLDCYSFSLAAPTSSFGGVLEIDPWLNKLAIDVTSVSLFGGGVLGGQTVGALIGVDDTIFSFSGLLAGTYTLAVASDVDPAFGFWNQAVGYVGSIATVASRSVPEPGGLALIGLGLIGLAALRHKR